MLTRIAVQNYRTALALRLFKIHIGV